MNTPPKIAILGRVFEEMPELIRNAGLGEPTLVPEAPLAPLDQVHEAVRDARGIVSLPHVPVGRELMEIAGPDLKVICNYAVGLDNIDLEEARSRGITVCNTPEPVCEPTADIAWLLLMGAARRVREGERLIQEQNWAGFAADLLLGKRMVGKTLLIVGAGRIGAAVARRSIGWNMRLLYVANSQKPDLESPPLNGCRVSLDDGLREADFISLHLPLNPETRHLIDSEKFALMKPDAVLVNTARGPVVEEEALIKALTDQQIFGAGLDVFDGEPQVRQELRDLPNVLTLPHLGSATREDRHWTMELVIQDLARLLQ